MYLLQTGTDLTNKQIKTSTQDKIQHQCLEECFKYNGQFEQFVGLQ